MLFKVNDLLRASFFAMKRNNNKILKNSKIRLWNTLETNTKEYCAKRNKKKKKEKEKERKKRKEKKRKEKKRKTKRKQRQFRHSLHLFYFYLFKKEKNRKKERKKKTFILLLLRKITKVRGRSLIMPLSSSAVVFNIL